MQSTTRHRHALGIGLILLASLACDRAGSDAILGTDSTNAAVFAKFGVAGEIPIQEGLSLGADPEEIRLDPCDPEAPVDPDSGNLLGGAMIAALLLDPALAPIVDAEVVFSASAGSLDSQGLPVLTDERGLAIDTLAVDEEDVGDVVITASAGDFTDMLVVPVRLLPTRPVTLEMSPDELWPPNHSMREVRALFDGLDCRPGATFELISVSSNEPDNGLGDGDTDNDIQGADVGSADTELLLRAERAGGRSGRVYTLTYELTDGEGEVSMLPATVIVPHDQGH